MEDKERFQTLYQSLVDGNKEYVDFITKVIGILLIGIGWLVANDDPFPFLTNSTLLNTSLVAVVLGAVAISWVSIFHLSRSNMRYNLLRDLKYTEEPIYEHYRISLKMIGPVLFIHSGLFLVIFVLMLYRYGKVA
jgi:hypothetical protein